MVYLDQFVISNMTNELDPQASPKKKAVLDGFYRLLFEKLERLSKLQLLVCPDSILRENESLVHSGHKKFRRIFRQLSNGITFRDPELLLNDEIMDAFRAWAGLPPIEPNWRPLSFSRDPHEWQERFRIEPNFTVPGVDNELRAASAQNNAVLAEWMADCRAHPHDTFEQSFEREMRGIGRRILNGFYSFLQQRHAVAQGIRPWDFDVMLPSESASCMFQALDLLRPHLSFEAAVQRVADFFESPAFRAVRAVRITGSILACLDRQFRGTRKRPVESGVYNDIDAVATYAGLSEAMFIDKEMADLCGEREPKAELTGLARIFSLKDKNAFLAFLDALEATAAADHIALVAAVYGAKWTSPYTSLLANAKP